MSGFKLGGMTLGSLFKKPETTCYPFEQRPKYEGMRGSVSIEPEKCILCGICQRTCPCAAITVDKKARTWSISRFSCVCCSACVYACPKDCLATEVDYTKPATAKSLDTVEVPE